MSYLFFTLLDAIGPLAIPAYTLACAAIGAYLSYRVTDRLWSKRHDKVVAGIHELRAEDWARWEVTQRPRNVVTLIRRGDVAAEPMSMGGH